MAPAMLRFWQARGQKEWPWPRVLSLAATCTPLSTQDLVAQRQAWPPDRCGGRRGVRGPLGEKVGWGLRNSRGSGKEAASEMPKVGQIPAPCPDSE